MATKIKLTRDRFRTGFNNLVQSAAQCATELIQDKERCDEEERR